MTDIGNRIKCVRKDNALTQKQFSEVLGTSRPHITNIELGKKKPSKPLTRLISHKFEVNEEWLLDGRRKGKE